MQFIKKLKQRTEEKRLLLLQQLMTPDTSAFPFRSGKT